MTPVAKILFFTAYDSPQVMLEISELGALGYVSKSRAGNDLVDAVRAILAGEKFFRKSSAALLKTPIVSKVHRGVQLIL